VKVYYICRTADTDPLDFLLSQESCQLSNSRHLFRRNFFYLFRNFFSSGFDKLEIQTTEQKSEIEIFEFFAAENAIWF